MNAWSVACAWGPGDRGVLMASKKPFEIVGERWEGGTCIETIKFVGERETYDVVHHQLQTSARRPTEEEEKKWLRLG